jgi:uncharacterized protein YoxC
VPTQLSELASFIIVGFYVVASLVLIGLVAFAAWAVWKLHNMLEKYEARITPVIEKADQVLTLIGEKVDTIGGKAESILSQGEEMAESVHEKVDRTATSVQRTINAPIIKANSWAAALTQGFSTFTRLQMKEGHRFNGRRSRYEMELAETPEETIIETTAIREPAEVSQTPHEAVDTLIEIPDAATIPRSKVLASAEEEKYPPVLGRKG